MFNQKVINEIHQNLKSNEDNLIILKYAPAIILILEKMRAGENNINIFLELGNLLRNIGDYNHSALCYRQILTNINSPHPLLAIIHNQLGWVLRKLNLLEEALEHFEIALSIQPNFYGARANRSLILLQMGRFAEGFAEYEARFLDCPSLSPAQHFPRWQGCENTPLKNKSILILPEQGFGDQIQFLRYAPLLAEQGAKVSILIKPELKRLAQTMPLITEVFSHSQEPVSYDYQIELMSLPYFFKTDENSIPNQTPYFFPKIEDTLRWRNLINHNENHYAKAKINIGLLWRGARREDDDDAYNLDCRRSIPLAKFNFLSKIQNINLISLQINDNEIITQEINDWQRNTANQIRDYSTQIKDFYDSACLVNNLDLVIAVDTAIAHLAGALSKKVILLNRYAGCWRWLTNSQDSPWYPNMQIIHQTTPDSWDEVLAKLNIEVSKLH